MSASIDMMEESLRLPKVLDLVAAASLLESFIDRRGSPLVIDGGDVERVGAQCLQILLAARAAWATDNQVLALENCSDDLRAGLVALGTAPESLTFYKEQAA
ncbi:MAG: STAS domain-containing protein [Acidocella sp.]|nr:STAS domain-containing protein [Acidocella sp.]